ncbi:phosphate transport system permease protein [Marisediminitalea aggregata]|jgi:phosphate transport system permease protein|uniref:Phosphate transport system permease protein PstA n=2 Tax=Marisediminitalea TaxID=2662254 RepID=A0A1M5HI23_9ALTE|nr:phosphate ABC transporter permease PstA [Marisediminitalea aggregata]MCP4526050.1 phosphate ABC transporter permease PstA [Aestuariibacter sp.]MEC7823397.1 phosphate ABC transporter permease PstA [Pseudomonadota bacterium]SHG15538.1 phosphate transport system permease protein [Marisediminitalea aggregata]
MGKWSVRQFLSNRQQQSFVISLGAFCASLLLVALVCVLALIALRGSDYFWPRPVHSLTYVDLAGKEHKVYGQVGVGHASSQYSAGTQRLWLIRYSDTRYPYGNQLILETPAIQNLAVAKDAADMLLADGTRVFAKPVSVDMPENQAQPLSSLAQAQARVDLLQQDVDQIRTQHLAPIHRRLAELDIRAVAEDAPARERLSAEFREWQTKVLEREAQIAEFRLNVQFSDGAPFSIALNELDQLTYTGQLTTWGKLGVAADGVWTFLSESPKQANTAGGVFPALFGTVLMIFIMTILVTPFGVMAAIYLNEYAPDNSMTAVIRICVSNMAGVPSIVYGVFGLGFFVYMVGGQIDELFFSDRLPAPTMGTPGVFWAALTMAILTLPVVIVATEEGLRRVPDRLKAGSYALGATKLETIWHTILPIASPGIMTGVILAIARAAGEVAPLMLVGAVKFAPNLPFDGEFPYLHLDRQFMHLGVLIYDGAFHSQTDMRSASMMFASCLLLLLVVFVLNILAVILRKRLRQRYLRGY